MPSVLPARSKWLTPEEECSGDPTRVAAQVVTGIVFWGAGVILSLPQASFPMPVCPRPPL